MLALKMEKAEGEDSMVEVVKQVDTPDCGSGARLRACGFDSRPSPHNLLK